MFATNGVVMEGGEGVALVIILCRLTDDLKNHTVKKWVEVSAYSLSN